MKFRKLIALFLAVVLAFGMVACGAEQPEAPAEEPAAPTEEPAEKPAEEAEKPAEEPEAPAADNDPFKMPEPTTVKIGVASDNVFNYVGGETSEKNAWTDLYAENNIMVDVMYEVDVSQADAKLTNAIISGDYPDFIMTNSVSEYLAHAESGVIADITDVFEQYATPELKEYLNADGGSSLDYIKIDGRLYGLPNIGNGYDAVPMMFVRQDWLDNLGLEMPKTMEELHEVAYAFSHNDPDGNGKDDTYGLAVDGVSLLTYGPGDLSAIFSGFGAHIGRNAMNFIEEDGQLTWGGTKTENMKAALTMLHEMYEDGSIAKDFITVDGNQLFEETAAGRCGIWFCPMWGAMGAIGGALKTAPYAHITSAAVPAGMGQELGSVIVENVPGNVNCISSQCEHPEVLIKIMNLTVQKLCHPVDEAEYKMYTGDNVNYSGWKCSLSRNLPPLKNLDNYVNESAAVAAGSVDAVEGITFEQIADATNILAFLDAYNSDGCTPEEMEDAAVTAGAGLYTVFADPEGSYAAIDKMIQNGQFVSNAYNFVPTQNMVDNSATLLKLTAETIVKIITGTEDVDYYDTFLENWMALGGADCIADAQAWYDAR